MRIYTSYFANWRKFPEGAVQIAVCLYPPRGYKGKVYSKLAPDKEMMQGMKCNSTRDFFAMKYLECRLKPLSPEVVKKELEELSGGKDVVLLCYEKPVDFCHRHLIARWLSQGMEVKEI